MTDTIRGMVSIVVTVFNRPAMLREAVASALAQTYRPIEVIIVDDASTDGTPDVVADLAASSPGVVFPVVLPKNGGPGVAREAGRTRVRGDFVQYLDSDDLLYPRKLELQVAALRDSEDAGVSYCFTRYRPAAGSPVEGPWKGSGEQRSTMFPWFLTERWWDTPTPLYRRTVCDAAGPWLPLRLEEDWEWDCRIASSGVKLVQVPEFLAEVRDHAGDRLCRGDALSPSRLADRGRAHLLVLNHARSAQIDSRSEFMQRFSRELFHLSRQCGAAGLVEPAQELFDAARSAAGHPRSAGLDFRLYRTAAALLGWTNVGRLATWADSRHAADDRRRVRV